MAELQFDQINIVVADVIGATTFLKALGADVDEMAGEWAEWAPHHVGFVTAPGFCADIDSPAYAAHWGGLPRDFAGVVVNLRAEDRDQVDATYERALELGGRPLRAPYDAFWGARYAVVTGPGPLAVGIMSPADQAARGTPPAVSDFAEPPMP